jgi:CRISPR/Cas system-associated exonuclease Cas4 (RecB family)
MSRRIVLGPRESMIDAVANFLDTTQSDHSATTIIFPGKRPAHFLRRELARRIGAAFIPPRIVSIDDFIEVLHAEIEPESTTALDAVDAVGLLYQIHQRLEERLGGDVFRTLDSFLPIGFKLFGELEELHLSGYSEQRIIETLEGIPYDYRHTLGRYYREFYALVGEGHYTTRAMRYHVVSERIDEADVSGHSPIILAGFYKLTGAEQRILDGLQRLDETIVVYQTDKDEQDGSVPEHVFINAPDIHGQVFALAESIRPLLEHPDDIDDKTVIVLPTADALFPVVEHVLSGLPEERYNVAFGYPVARTPIVGFLNALLGLIHSREHGRYGAGAYVSFILHPYTKNVRLNGRADVTRILMHGLEETLAQDRSRLLVSLEELESSEELFTEIAFAHATERDKLTPEVLRDHLKAIHDHTIRGLEQIDSIGALAEAIERALTYIYDESTASLHPLFRPYAEALLGAFQQVRTSLLASESFEHIEGYLAFVRHIVERTEVPFPGTPLRGLQVLGMLETRGLQFDRVCILQMTDDCVPGSVGSDLLLPQQVREKLGLETVTDRDDLIEHHLRLLTAGAKRVEIYYSEAGRSVRSRFVEKLLWQRQRAEQATTTERYVQTVRYRLQLTNTLPPPIEKDEDIIPIVAGMPFSAYALDTYIRCPLRFYYQYVLRLKEKGEAAEDLDQLEIGDFVHEALRRYFEPLVGRELTKPDLDGEALDHTVTNLFRERYGAHPPGTMFLVERQVRRRLREFVADYQHPICEAAQVRIVGVEVPMRAEAFGSRLSGRVVRREERDGIHHIVDYKTGAPISRTKIRFKSLNPEDRATYGRAIGSMQLPFYLLMAVEGEGMAPERISASYVFLGGRHVDNSCEEYFAGDSGERIERYGMMSRVIEKVIYEIKAATVPFLPTEDPAAHCGSCPFSGICGTKWVG